MRQLAYGSVCSGIEAATVAWRPMGWRAKFFSENDRFPESNSLRLWERAGTVAANRVQAVLQTAAFAQNSRDEVLEKPIADSLKAGGGKPGQSYPAIRDGMAVRRLTPRECERLQGFPDDYTLVPFRGKPAKDAPRYRAIGNSMAVPVMRWIGERIARIDAA